MPYLEAAKVEFAPGSNTEQGSKTEPAAGVSKVDNRTARLGDDKAWTGPAGVAKEENWTIEVRLGDGDNPQKNS